LLSILYYYILIILFYVFDMEDVSYSKIACTMIKQVNEFLIDRTREIRENANYEEKEDDELLSK